MSLNGLDDDAVQEAYRLANTEAGGWLLLKYASRDSVALLARGKGGVHDARTAIAKYEDASPLYGLMAYRRKKVLIKYVPEGTSRVLLARTAVHWQDILEKFAPYETVLEIKSAEGLNDTSLAATFPMHAGSPAASSNRLGEISEDAEDPGPAAPAQESSSGVRASSLSSRVRQRAQRQTEQRLQAERSPPPSIRVEDVNSKPTTETQVSTATTPKKAHISQFLVRDDSGQRSITSLSSASTAPTSQFSSSVESPVKPQERGGQVDISQSATSQPATSQSTIPQPATSAKSSTTESSSPPSTAPAPPLPPLSEKRTLRGVEMLTEKPPPEIRYPNGRVERPITKQEVSSQTAAETSGKLTFDDDPYDFSRYDLKPKVKLGPRPVTVTDKSKRPSTTGVASIPATHRPAMIKKQDMRPKSTGPMTMPALTSLGSVPAPPPIPDMPEYTPRPVSRGSIKSLPSHKSTAMTPDKIRLMKAVEHRKKLMRKSNPQPSFVPPPEDDVPAVPAMPDRSEDISVEKSPEVDPSTHAVQRVEEQSGKKADSGISMNDEQDEAGAEEETPTQKPEPPLPDTSIPEESAESTVEPQDEETARPASKEGLGSPKIDTPRAAPPASAPEEESASSSTPKASATEVPSPEEEKMRTADEKPDRGLGLDLPAEEGATAVPTIVMADGTRPVSSSQKEEGGDAGPSSPASSESSTEDDDHENTGVSDLEPPEPQLHHKSSDIAKRRRGYVEPLNLDQDEEFSSDDELMDELQTATLQEATPMTVSKSPLNSYFPRRPSANSIVSEVSVRSVNINRSSTLPLDFAEMQDRLSPEPVRTSPGRLSSPSDERIDSLAAMRRNVSSGISRRIQALAEVSSRESMNSQGSGSSRPISPETARNPHVDYRDSRRSPPPHPSRASSMRAMHRQSARMSSYQNHSLASSRPPVEINTVYSVQTDPETNRDSVSVSARIIRPTVAEPTGSDDANSDLQQPQLVINHKRGSASQSKSPPQLHQIDTTPTLPQSSRPDSMSSRTISPETTRSPVESRTLHSATRSRGHKPTTSVAGPSVEDFPAPPPPTTSTAAPPDEPAQHSTRTSRFFKRMSNIGSKRKSTAPQSISNSTSPASERGSVITAHLSIPKDAKDRGDMPPAVHVGDLNIQFPDSLLWKRRILELDDSGNLVFLIPQPLDHQRHNASFTKKFPLADFKCPSIPDLERQELPHSILLDFADGGGTTLQVACEDAGAQRRVAGLLRGYWRAWV